MSDDHSPDREDEADRFIITNMNSKYDLDFGFRIDDDFLARGPFKVHSPDTATWHWGYRLEQAGDHLVFQDGTSLGRTIMTDAVSVRSSDEGSIIWLFGFEGSRLTVLTLTAATIEDYRKAIPAGIAVSSFDDGARVVMAELEAKRRARFGLDFDPVLTNRLGLVFRDDSDATTLGLYHFGPGGKTQKRDANKWVNCDFTTESWRLREARSLCPVGCQDRRGGKIPARTFHQERMGCPGVSGCVVGNRPQWKPRRRRSQPRPSRTRDGSARRRGYGYGRCRRRQPHRRGVRGQCGPAGVEASDSRMAWMAI